MRERGNGDSLQIAVITCTFMQNPGPHYRMDVESGGNDRVSNSPAVQHCPVAFRTQDHLAMPHVAIQRDFRCMLVNGNPYRLAVSPLSHHSKQKDDFQCWVT